MTYENKTQQQVSIGEYPPPLYKRTRVRTRAHVDAVEETHSHSPDSLNDFWLSLEGEINRVFGAMPIDTPRKNQGTVNASDCGCPTRSNQVPPTYRPSGD